MSLPPFIEPRFEQHKLDNGLRVILHRDPRLPLVAVNLWYHVGSKHERPGRTGFAHLFEHMLFQGSQNVAANDHFRYVQQAGGVANGSTWYDRTNYYETLPAQHLDLGLWLESDRMGFLLPALTTEKLETQRQVVMNERRQRVDNQPYGLAAERLFELLFPKPHPYHWPVIGYMEDIAAASLEEVEEFFRTYYVPSNAVLTLAGDIDPTRALERVKHFFEPIPSGPPPKPSPPELPPLDGEQRAIVEDNVQLPRSYIAFRLPAYGRKAWYAADLLAAVLTGGKSSRLYQDLVYRRQLAQDVGAYVSPTEDDASFVITATAKPGAEPETLESLLTEHLARMATEAPTEQEVERARSRLLTAYFSDLQTVDRRADLLSQFTTFFNDPGRMGREAQSYTELESADLALVAHDFLGVDARVRLTVLPAQIPV